MSIMRIFDLQIRMVQHQASIECKTIIDIEDNKEKPSIRYRNPDGTYETIDYDVYKA